MRVGNLTQNFLCLLLVCPMLCMAGGKVYLNDFYGEVDHIDSVNLHHRGQNFEASFTSNLKIQRKTLKGISKDVLHLNNQQGQQAQYAAFFVAQNKGLKAGDLLIVDVEYPDNYGNAFSMYVLNRACGKHAGFATGESLGVALNKYLTSNAESLAYHHSGEFKHWRQMCFAHENVADITVAKNADPMQGKIQNGFWLIFAQGAFEQDPLSKGGQIASVNIYRVPNPDRIKQNIVYPPTDLSKPRHIGQRNEMGANVYMMTRGDAHEQIKEYAHNGQRLPAKAAYGDPIKWVENRIRLNQILGANGIILSLMEFGSNKFWPDLQGQFPYGRPRHPGMYNRILNMLAIQYPQMALQNYYEYEGKHYLLNENEKIRTEPLKRKKFNSNDPMPLCTGYGEHWFTETLNADITSSKSLRDLKQIVDKTIVNPAKWGSAAVKAYMENGFLGPWFRPKSVALPIGFNKEIRERFAQEKHLNTTPGKYTLESNSNLYEQYIDWWYQKRQQTFQKVQEHIELNLPAHDNIKTRLTFYSKETGPRVVGTNSIIYDRWDRSRLNFFNFNEIVHSSRAAWERYPKALFDRQVGWANNHCGLKDEPFHADPGPYGQGGASNVYETYPLLQRSFSAVHPSQVQGFRNNEDGQVTVSQFRSLNEDVLRVKNDKGENIDLTGYFVSDVERAGSYATLSLAKSLAYHDPNMIQILSSYNYTTGYPEVVARFNRAYLSLPTIPSYVRNDLVRHHNKLYVRVYPATEHGKTYVALINVSLQKVNQNTLKLPVWGKVYDLVNGEKRIHPNGSNAITVDIDPGEVQTFRVDHF